MAKLLGPDFMSLQVRDLADSRAFYFDLLGFTEDPDFRAPGFVLCTTTTIPFGISEARVNLDEAGMSAGCARAICIGACSYIRERQLS